MNDKLAAAIAQHRAGDLASAERLYREIIAEPPGADDAQHLLGVILFQTGRHAEAVESIQAAIARNGSKAEVFNNLSLPLRELGRHEEAVAATQRAVALRPDYAEAHANQGLALMELGRYEDAAASFRRAVSLKPGMAGFHNNLGNAYRGLKQYEEAEKAYRQAVALQPSHAHALFGLGVVLDELDKRQEAVAALQEAVRLNDSLADAHGRIGAILSVIGLPEESARSLRRALELEPENLNALVADAAVQNYLDEATPDDILRGARAFSHKLIERAGDAPEHPNEPAPERPLRIGFCSGDLGAHPVGEFTRSVLNQIDRNRFRLFAYCTRRLANPMTGYFDVWRYADRLSDDDLTAQIRADAIDILIDLSGYTLGSRPMVFASKPAPVQASWLGYSGTTGNPRVDYIIVDGRIVPDEQERFYEERPWRLPDSYVCWTEPAVEVAVAPLPALTSGAVTFGSFNNVRKISVATAKAWARILAGAAGSRLLLKSSGNVDPVAYTRVKDIIVAEGIEAERIAFTSTVPDKADHYRHYNRVDIALDPFPYNGTTTTVEALWMGVPVVTIAGNRFISRVGESIMTTLGSPEWSAETMDDYVRIAVSLAADVPALAEIRASLRPRLVTSPLCDAPRFARNFENALRGMWRAWCEKRAESPPQ